MYTRKISRQQTSSFLLNVRTTTTLESDLGLCRFQAYYNDAERNNEGVSSGSSKAARTLGPADCNRGTRPYRIFSCALRSANRPNGKTWLQVCLGERWFFDYRSRKDVNRTQAAGSGKYLLEVCPLAQRSQWHMEGFWCLKSLIRACEVSCSSETLFNRLACLNHLIIVLQHPLDRRRRTRFISHASSHASHPIVLPPTPYDSSENAPQLAP
jgi:hypothetical protein